MTHGKNICNQLKEVRKRIAEENSIPLEVEECTYKGECRGTCPRCEAEVRYLENALADRLRLGKVATVAGLALGLASCGGGTSSPQGSQATLAVDDSAPAADTTQAAAGSRDSLWREPLPPLDVVVGGDFVVSIDEALSTDTTPEVEAIVEEGEDEEESMLASVITETDPEFPGGYEALQKFLQENIRYPQLALDNGIQGRVYVTFVVEEDGSITGARVLRDIGGGCGREALRVVGMMPKWKPGEQRGKVVRTQFNLPVNFVLPEDRPRVIEGMAPAVQVEIIDTTPQIEVGNPNAPTQQMEREGVKVIVR